MKISPLWLTSFPFTLSFKLARRFTAWFKKVLAVFQVLNCDYKILQWKVGNISWLIVSCVQFNEWNKCKYNIDLGRCRPLFRCNPNTLIYNEYYNMFGNLSQINFIIIKSLFNALRLLNWESISLNLSLNFFAFCLLNGN